MKRSLLSLDCLDVKKVLYPVEHVFFIPRANQKTYRITLARSRSFDFLVRVIISKVFLND